MDSAVASEIESRAAEIPRPFFFLFFFFFYPLLISPLPRLLAVWPLCSRFLRLALSLFLTLSLLLIFFSTGVADFHRGHPRASNGLAFVSRVCILRGRVERVVGNSSVV